MDTNVMKKISKEVSNVTDLTKEKLTEISKNENV